MTELTARPGNTSWLLRHGRVVLGLAAFICVVAIAFLALEISRELRVLASANSDNVEWVLSQAEVELLDFRDAVEAAGNADADPASLQKVVVEFDILYSRLMTLDTGLMFSELRRHDGFGPPVADIRARLDAMIPLIDGPRPQLRAGLDQLAAGAEAIRPLLRVVATTGLQFFAEQADASREEFLIMLLRLAQVTLALIMALSLVLVYTWHASRQIAARGRELSIAYSRLNTILETSLDAVVVSDVDGRILNFNAAAERIFQHFFEDVVGRNIADVIIPDHFRAAHDAGMRRMQTTGEKRVVGHGRVRLEAQRADGEIFPVELALQKAQANGETIIVAFLRDISHRVAAERELVETRDKALAGEKAKADFLAMMTHEIRTPLNGLLGNLSLLEQTPLTPAQTRYVRSMTISGGVLMQHVDAVLDVARFESGASVVRQEVVHLGSLIEDIVESQVSAAEAGDNHIQWGWVGDPVDWAQIDAARLRQILLNLVGNAIKFTRNGRIQIEAETDRDTDHDMLELRVIDTGIGISRADQEKVFDDFHIGQDADQSGTGLGLGIARRFVGAMGGEIGVESTEGEGSVFWLRVPFVRAAPPEPAEGTVAPQHQAASLDVLLVEDNEINLELAREMLLNLGHDVIEARNGEEAVAQAGTRRFDLILMDIRMPRLDGLGATRAIREGRGASRDTPIIALSANVLPEAKESFFAAGMSGFLPKPMRQADLQQVIARLSQAAPEEGPTPAAQPSRLDKLLDRHKHETAALFDWLASGPSDRVEIAERAHKLAGSAAAFGQSDLRQALIALETAAEGGDDPALDRAIRAARGAWQRAPEPTLD